MKILHTADIHIGYSTHGKDDPKRGINSRWIDFERCFKFLVDVGLQEDIDLFLFCGDAYRDASPSPSEQRIFAQAIRPLIDKKIPIVMLVGNHDSPVAFGKANSLNIFGDLTNSVYLYDKPMSKDIQTKSGMIRVVGLPWANRSKLIAREAFSKHTSEQIRDEIHKIYSTFISAEADRVSKDQLDFPCVLAMHAHIDGAELTEGSEKPLMPSRDIVLSLSSILRKEFSYVALGHFHRFQDLNPDSHPPVVYSGSIERVSFNEWTQKKGFVLLTIDEHKKAVFRHVETPSRPMISLEIDTRFSGDEVMRKIQAEIEKVVLQEAIVRVRIRCKMEQKKLIDYKQLRDLLKEAFVVSQITATHDEEKKEKGEMSLEALSPTKIFETFIDLNPNLIPKKAKLVSLSKELEQSDH